MVELPRRGRDFGDRVASVECGIGGDVEATGAGIKDDRRHPNLVGRKKRSVVLETPNVAMSVGLFGTVAGFQLAAVFQSPLVGLRFPVALPAWPRLTPSIMSGTGSHWEIFISRGQQKEAAKSSRFRFKGPWQRGEPLPLSAELLQPAAIFVSQDFRSDTGFQGGGRL